MVIHFNEWSQTLHRVCAKVHLLLQLLYLTLSQNQFSGTLPSSWSKCKVSLAARLVLLHQFPQWWAGIKWLDASKWCEATNWRPMMQNLEALSLDENHLVGTLPESWSDLINVSQCSCCRSVLFDEHLAMEIQCSYCAMVAMPSEHMTFHCHCSCLFWISGEIN